MLLLGLMSWDDLVVMRVYVVESIHVFAQLCSPEMVAGSMYLILFIYQNSDLHWFVKMVIFVEAGFRCFMCYVQVTIILMVLLLNNSLCQAAFWSCVLNCPKMMRHDLKSTCISGY